MLRSPHIPVLFGAVLSGPVPALALVPPGPQPPSLPCTALGCAPEWVRVALLAALAAAGALFLLAAYLFRANRRLARAAPLEQESQDDYRDFFEMANDFAYTMDLHTCFTRVNHALLEATGYTREELVGAHASKILSPENMAKGQEMVSLRLNGERKVTRYELELTAKDGRQIPIELISTVTRREGRIVAIQGIGRDITERKRAEANLRQLKAQLQMQIDRMPIGYIVWDQDFRVKAWNPAAASLFGFTEAEALGKHPYELIVPAEARPAVEKIWGRLLMGDLTAYSVNENLTRDGRTLLCEWSNTPVFGPDGATVSVLSMVKDVTERAQAQAALQLAKERAEEANRAKSHFLSNMSHEIRTPVNTIIGMTQLALKHERDPRQRSYLTNISLSGEHLLGVIDDILDFTKIEAGKLALESTDFALDQIRQTLTNLVAWKAAEKQLRVSFDFDAAIPQTLRGDPLRLSQILINYVNNAIKFTQQGEIIVRARVAEDGGDSVLVRLEVQDTGIGISERQKTRLFQEFQQADSTTSRRYGGSGLGLAICKRLAEFMGGAVGVQSALGRGSTFWFTARLGKGNGASLPRDAGRERAGGDELAAMAVLRGARILVAEDHPFNQTIAREFLEDAQAIVCVANNGKEALDLLRLESFDCVLMDVQMPVMDGLEATRMMRADGALPNIPVIALTANALDVDRDRCIAVGMNDFIGKPFRLDNFYATLAKWLPEKTHE